MSPVLSLVYLKRMERPLLETCWFFRCRFAFLDRSVLHWLNNCTSFQSYCNIQDISKQKTWESCWKKIFFFPKLTYLEKKKHKILLRTVIETNTRQKQKSIKWSSNLTVLQTYMQLWPSFTFIPDEQVNWGKQGNPTAVIHIGKKEQLEKQKSGPLCSTGPAT